MPEKSLAVLDLFSGILLVAFLSDWNGQECRRSPFVRLINFASAY